MNLARGRFDVGDDFYWISMLYDRDWKPLGNDWRTDNVLLPIWSLLYISRVIGCMLNNTDKSQEQKEKKTKKGIYAVQYTNPAPHSVLRLLLFQWNFFAPPESVLEQKFLCLGILLPHNLSAVMHRTASPTAPFLLLGCVVTKKAGVGTLCTYPSEKSG